MGFHYILNPPRISAFYASFLKLFEIKTVYDYFIFKIKILISNINMRSSVNKKYVTSPFFIFLVIQIYVLNISLENQQLLTDLLSFSNATY